MAHSRCLNFNTTTNSPRHLNVWLVCLMRMAALILNQICLKQHTSGATSPRIHPSEEALYLAHTRPTRPYLTEAVHQVLSQEHTSVHHQQTHESRLIPGSQATWSFLMYLTRSKDLLPSQWTTPTFVA